jgi:hypothetical protein
MEYADLPKRHLFSNKMYVDFNVLGAPVLNSFRGHVYRADVVTKDHSCSMYGLVEFAKELSYPAALGDSMCYRPILRFGT